MLGKSRQELKKDQKKRAKNKRTGAFRKLSAKQKMALKKAQKASRKGGAVRKRLKSRKATQRRIGDSHDVEFINAIVENALEEGNTDTALALLSLSPDVTSTDEGAYAFEVMETISAMETEAGKSFLDVEVIGEDIIVYFKKAKGDLSESIEEDLEDLGKVEIIATPGEAISETEVCDLYIAKVTPKKRQMESVITDLFTDEDLESIDEAVEELNGTVADEDDE